MGVTKLSPQQIRDFGAAKVPFSSPNFAAENTLDAVEEVLTKFNEYKDSGKRFSRSAENIALSFSTDDLLAHDNQTLATLIDKEIQETIFINYNTSYNLNIFITQGETVEDVQLRINGLVCRYAFVNVYIDPGVELSYIGVFGNTCASIRIFNCGNVSGTVDVTYNHAVIGGVSYNQNYCTTVSPTYPIGHPTKSGEPVTLLKSIVKGNINVNHNIVTTDVYAIVGQNCEVGVVDSNGVISGGAINVSYNTAGTSIGITVYTVYAETTPTLAGAIIYGSMNTYYNRAGYDVYLNVQSGWKAGTEPTISHTNMNHNKSGRHCMSNIGTCLVNGFAGYYTATANPDSSVSARNTFTLSSDLTPGQAATIVGMWCNFTNYTTASNANNYTGTWKKVTAYNPTTKTVTLDSTFTNPRPLSAICYFFPSAGQTKFYYGENPKVETMLQTALSGGTNNSMGIFNTTGANFGTANRVSAIDTTNKVVTVANGLAADTTYNAWCYVGGSFAPKTYGDHPMAIHKIGTNSFRSIDDVRFYAKLNTDAVGCKITGGVIPAGESRTVSTAGWGGTSYESRLTMTFNADDTGAIAGETCYQYILRRVPGMSQHNISCNEAGSAVYQVAGEYSISRNGALRVRHFSLSENKAGSSVYFESYGFEGTTPNQNSSLKADYIDLISNQSGFAVYCVVRSNRNGGTQSLTRVRAYQNNTGRYIYLIFSVYTDIQRTVDVYYNNASSRIYIDCESPPNIGSSQATAPLIRSRINIWENTTSLLFVQRVNVVMATLAQTGAALTDAPIYFAQNNVQRVHVSSATWVNCSANTAAYTACVRISEQVNYEIYAFNAVVGGTQCYAIRAGNAYNLSLLGLPVGSNKIIVGGSWGTLFVENAIPTNTIYTDSHVLGRNKNINVFKGGALLPTL